MSVAAQYTAILVVYFAAMLALGLWFERRQRNRTDYFLARGKLGAGTIKAVGIGGEVLGQHLDGDIAVELRIPRRIHLPHHRRVRKSRWLRFPSIVLVPSHDLRAERGCQTQARKQWLGRRRGESVRPAHDPSVGGVEARWRRADPHEAPSRQTEPHDFGAAFDAHDAILFLQPGDGSSRATIGKPVGRRHRKLVAAGRDRIVDLSPAAGISLLRALQLRWSGVCPAAAR